MNSENWSYLVRRVRNKPNYFKGDRVSSALFKDKKGVSVNRDDDRDIGSVIEDELRLHDLYNGDIEKENDEFKLKAIVSVSKELCESREIQIISDALEENPHHSLLIRNRETIVLSEGQAKALARGAQFIKKHEQ